MQRMLEESESDSREMRRKYVNLGDRLAELVRSRSVRVAAAAHPPEVQVRCILFSLRCCLSAAKLCEQVMN